MIIEHLFICLFAFCISSLMRCLLKPFAHFKSQVVCFLIIEFLRVLYIFWVTVLYQIRLWEYFIPVFSLSSGPHVSFREQQFLILMKSSLSIIFLMNHIFDILSKKSLPNPRPPECFHMASPRVSQFYYILYLDRESILS